MRFIISFATFLAGSLVLASPIAHPAPADSIESRSTGPLCEIGAPCWMQKTVNDAQIAVEVLVDDLEVPVANITAGLNIAANLLESAAVYANASLTGLSAELATELSAAIVAAISPFVTLIVTGISQITSTVVDLTGEVKATANGCLTAIINIEAAVGPCTSPNVPVTVS